MSAEHLERIEAAALAGVRSAASGWFAKNAKPISNVVLYLTDGVCEPVYCNVDGLNGKTDDALAAHVASTRLRGPTLSKRVCFDLSALPHAFESTNDLVTIMRFAHRICARLEATKALGDGVDVAADFVAIPLEHDAEDRLDPKLRRLAREWLKQPVDKYMRSFGKR